MIFEGGAKKLPVMNLSLKSIALLSPATRTLKNSSRLLENIPKKRIRRCKGTLLSMASCNTLSLKANQVRSRGLKDVGIVFGLMIQKYRINPDNKTNLY